MEGIKEFIEKLVSAELKHANNHTTRQTIHQRVVSAIAKELNVPLNHCVESKTVYLHPENSERFDEMWFNILKNKIQISHEESNAYEKIKSADYIKYPDLYKFLNILVRKHSIDRDPQNKEKILISKDLPQLLAIDGLAGFTNADVKNYVENLQVGNESEQEQDKHTIAVRRMYLLLPSLTGTDSICVIFLSLLKLYRNHITDQEAINKVDQVTTNVSDYLLKNSKYYTDLKETTQSATLEKLQECYSEIVDVAKLASQKISQMIQKEKRSKRGPRPEKKNRKRLRSENESNSEKSNDEEELTKTESE